MTFFQFSFQKLVYIGKFEVRKILSVLAQFFHPLGFFSPFVVLIKLLFQHLWRVDMAFDTPLLEDWLDEWNSLVLGLEVSLNFNINRSLCLLKGTKNTKSWIIYKKIDYIRGPLFRINLKIWALFHRTHEPAR